MNNEKKLNFYYSTMDSNGKTSYKCLQNGSYAIKELHNLDIENYKNFRMNNYYEESDEDLFKFRDDLIEHNNEIKKHFFKTKEGKIFKVDVFNSNTINNAVYNTVLKNSQQKVVNSIPDINFNELAMFENCLSCGLMSVDKEKLNMQIETFSYDYCKFYYYMMKKIRIPTCKPKYYVIDDLDMTKLDYGVYRVKVECSNPIFWNVFKFNPKHHYTHSTLKTLYKFKDRYDIKFKLLEPDSCYKYNMVWYEETVELKVLFREWFRVIDKLLKECKKSNWLLKTYVSQAWGTLSQYNKTFVHDENCHEYDFDHLDKIQSTNQYEYYNYQYINGIYTMVNSKKAFKYGGLARMKLFLTEFARNYMFNMISENNLEKLVIRIQTDSVSFTKAVDFKSLKIDYFPIEEEKTTGLMVFYNVNSYHHVCKKCNLEYKYEKNMAHICT